jgi:hypothetical protein
VVTELLILPGNVAMLEQNLLLTHAAQLTATMLFLVRDADPDKVPASPREDVMLLEPADPPSQKDETPNAKEERFATEKATASPNHPRFKQLSLFFSQFFYQSLHLLNVL